jgi:flagellar operon protein
MKSSGPGQVLYPQVSQIGPKPDTGASAKPGDVKPDNADFEKALKESLNDVQPALKFSNHAVERLRDRKINLDAKTMTGIRSAVEKAESKGLSDTLVLTKDAALIVNVKNKTVVTALDRDSINGNVFTNIDGAIVV